MKTEHTEIIAVKSKMPPTVEIDTQASAAYVRFKRAHVVKTTRHHLKWPIITFDFDQRGEVVGIEFVGVKKFNLGWLLQQVPLKTSPGTIPEANYISAEGNGMVGAK